MALPPRRLTLASVAAGLSVAAALAGCGGGEGGSSTTSAEAGAPVATPQTTIERQGAPGDQGGTQDGAAPRASREVIELTGFSSPSGNIGCFIDLPSVRCDIGERDWEPPQAPRRCELDYGQGIELPAGAEARFVCAGDTALGGGPALAYGDSIAAGLLRCESSEAGMSCRDIESGRGFSLSRQGYEIF
jgi:hypothetical protein